MRDGFTNGKGGLVQVQCAFEQHRQDVGRAAGLFGAGHHDFGQAVAVVVVQLANAGVHAGKRFAMRGQDQGVLGQGQKLVDGVQKKRQRVGLGLLLVHAHIGGNAWQHHVATNQHIQGLAIQGDVLGCMAVAADAAPGLVAYGQHAAIEHAAVAVGHGRHQ